jgi:hypothetical protein
MQDTGGRILYAGHWWTNTACRTLVDEYCMQDTGGRILHAGHWWTNTVCRTLVDEYCMQDTGGRIPKLSVSVGSEIISILC